MSRGRRAAAALALGSALVGVAVGCGGDGGSDPGGGTAIDVFGPYRGVEADRFLESVAGFTEATGVEVRYTGTADFAADVQDRVGEGNDPPDVAIVSQPGLVERLVADGAARPLGTDARSALDVTYGDGVRSLGEVDGEPYGVPFRASVKSLVWYRPEVFAAHGWEVPTTLDDLVTLVEEVVATDGIAPWCFTMEAGTSTGWAATDWVEDLLLRTAGPEDYERWADGDLAFASPEVTTAFERFQELVLAPGHLAGGLVNAVDAPVDEGGDALFTEPPGCALHKQASFALSWMPDGTTVGPDGDVDWFVLPGTDADQPPPLLVAGDQAVQLSDRPEVDAFVAYLAGDEAGRSWVEAGGFLTPKATVGPEVSPPGVDRDLAALLAASPVLGFDASDRMAPEVGSGLLWEDITAWVAGTLDLEDLSAEVDAARAAPPERRAAG